MTFLGSGKLQSREEKRIIPSSLVATVRTYLVFDIAFVLLKE